MRTKVALALVLLLPLSTPVIAQEGEQADTVQLGVELVQIDVVVTDEDGRRVTGLGPDDFEIYEDGRRQEITNFSYVEGPRAAAAPKADVKKGEPAPPPRSHEMRAGDVRRTIALVVDDLFTSFERVPGVKRALKKFVDEQMQPGDLAAVVLTSKGNGALQQFTSDKRLLHAAIDRVRFNPRGNARFFDTYGQDLQDLSALNRRREREGRETDLGDRPKVVTLASEFREDALSVGSLGALDFVVRSLRELPGRKSLVWFTEGFPLVVTGDSPGARRALDATRRLADRANRAGVVIYPVDVRGLLAPYFASPGDDPYAGSRAAYSRRRESEARYARDTQDVMFFVSEKTGGFVYSGNEPSVGLERAVRDQDGYYFIGYVPEAATFQLEDGKPRFHEIEVRVKRPDLKARSRTGFFGYVDERPPIEGARGEAARLAEAMLSPVNAGDVDLGLTAQVLVDASQGIQMRSMLHVDAADLTFADEGDGRLAATFDVVAFAVGESGLMESVVYETRTLRASAAELERYKTHGVVYTLNLPVKKHGPYQVRAAIRDKATDRVGTASEFVVVPDVTKGGLAVSGVALKSDATAVVGSNRFLAGAELTYFFAIYNPRVRSSRARPSLRMRLSLWRDGRQILAGDESPIAVDGQTDWRRINTVGSFALSRATTPGAYTLQVDVTDLGRGRKGETVTQYADFEVVGQVVP